MRCSSCEPLLDLYLEAALRPRESHAVSGHLRTCSDCAALMQELRVVDALLTTARAPHAGDITAAVVSATRATQPHAPRRVPFGLALLLYLFAAWALGVVAILRRHDLGRLATAAFAHVQRDVATLGAASHALAPATPMAAAAVTAVLLVDLVLLGAVLYGYRRLRPMLAVYLNRGPRP